MWKKIFKRRCPCPNEELFPQGTFPQHPFDCKKWVCINIQLMLKWVTYPSLKRDQTTHQPAQLNPKSANFSSPELPIHLNPIANVEKKVNFNLSTIKFDIWYFIYCHHDDDTLICDIEIKGDLSWVGESSRRVYSWNLPRVRIMKDAFVFFTSHLNDAKRQRRKDTHWHYISS